MSRMVSRRVSVATIYLALSSWLYLYAADKASRPTPAAAEAKRQVAAALRAEVAGDNQQREKLLASALNASPELAEANWHLARVHTGGQWLSLEDAERESLHDAQLQDYRKLRDEVADNPKQLRGLARWCQKAGWEDLARLHYAQLLASPHADFDAREEAIRRLDLRYVNGTWMAAADLADRQHRAGVIEEALLKWRPRLKRLQLIVDEGDTARRDYVIKELEHIDDPQVISALESFLVDGGDRFQEVAAKRLAKFPQAEATTALAYYAVLSPYIAARDSAAKALRDRSVFEYCPVLLGGFIAPLQTQFQIVAGRGDRIAYRHVVRQQTPQLDRTVVMDTISLPVAIGPQLPRGPETAVLRSELFGRQVAVLRGAAQSLDLQAAANNANAQPNNRRIAEVLRQATGQQLGDEPQPWWDWWQDYNQKWWPQVSQYVYGQQQRIYPTAQVRHSCFVAGTLVRTALGLTPIETIQPGDRVLSQDQDTGELAYKIVSATTVRPPGKLVRIRLGSESLTATLGHPFWVSGSGWRMAKELQSGDLLHGLSASLPIDSVEQLPDEQQAYNLVVNDFNTYFVGQQGLLVHDNEFRKPTRAIVPGLLEEQVAVVGAAKR
jgi:pretoxin HINT domain-containing protein